jgi:hypothetical protein
MYTKTEEKRRSLGGREPVFYVGSGEYRSIVI